jgi:hypothetical protein
MESWLVHVSGVLKWRIAGEEVVSCNCSWGCPCQSMRCRQLGAVEPIKNPATGEEHRARIALPNGFEYREAEMGNTVHCRVSAGDKLTFELKNTYAQLNAFDWSN